MKITEKIKMAVMGLAAVVTLGYATVIAPVANVSADSSVVYCPDGTTATTFDQCPDAGDNQQRSLFGTLNVIINVVLGVLGFVAVAMIIVGGVNYSTSAGDAAKVKKAKDTIMYGIVGLVIAMLGYAIVNFILANVFKS